MTALAKPLEAAAEFTAAMIAAACAAPRAGSDDITFNWAATASQLFPHMMRYWTVRVVPVCSRRWLSELMISTETGAPNSADKLAATEVSRVETAANT